MSSKNSFSNHSHTYVINLCPCLFHNNSQSAIRWRVIIFLGFLLVRSTCPTRTTRGPLLRISSFFWVSSLGMYQWHNRKSYTKNVSHRYLKSVLTAGCFGGDFCCTNGTGLKLENGTSEPFLFPRKFWPRSCLGKNPNSNYRVTMKALKGTQEQFLISRHLPLTTLSKFLVSFFTGKFCARLWNLKYDPPNQSSSVHSCANNHCLYFPSSRSSSGFTFGTLRDKGLSDSTIGFWLCSVKAGREGSMPYSLMY